MGKEVIQEIVLDRQVCLSTVDPRPIAIQHIADLEAIRLLFQDSPQWLHNLRPVQQRSLEPALGSLPVKICTCQSCMLSG